MINTVKTYFSTKRLTIDFFVRGGGGGVAKKVPELVKILFVRHAIARF